MYVQIYQTVFPLHHFTLQCCIYFSEPHAWCTSRPFDPLDLLIITTEQLELLWVSIPHLISGSMSSDRFYSNGHSTLWSMLLFRRRRTMSRTLVEFYCQNHVLWDRLQLEDEIKVTLRAVWKDVDWYMWFTLESNRGLLWKVTSVSILYKWNLFFSMKWPIWYLQSIIFKPRCLTCNPTVCYEAGGNISKLRIYYKKLCNNVDG
jgi:hypothetical protein